MNLLQNVSLSNYSTMRLGGPARYLAEAASERDVAEMINWSKAHDIDCLVIGGGSNIVWRDEGYPGLILVNEIKGREILADDEAGTTIRCGGGEVWDEVVGWSVGLGLSGIEFLSLIPGSTGAAPVQNIGAYGAELADTLVEVHAYDRQSGEFVPIKKADCGFGYRTSRFKTTDRGRFVITSVTLRLKKTDPKPPFYEVLQNFLDQSRVQNYTPEIIRKAVIAIRSAKLPDPAVVANNGSFFTNPFVSLEKYSELKSRYPDIKSWPARENHVKLAAGWLVEQAGFRGYHDPETGMATSDKQALVLINEHAKSTSDLLRFKAKIVERVEQMFGITLTQEPELLP